MSGNFTHVREMSWILVNIREMLGNCWGKSLKNFSKNCINRLFSITHCLPAELLELFVPALETMASEAASLGLEVNWLKTKVQALGSRKDEPTTVSVLGNQVADLRWLMCLSTLAPSFTQQPKAVLMSHAEMPLLVQLCRI